jgi:hypothetical protein
MRLFGLALAIAIPVSLEAQGVTPVAALRPEQALRFSLRDAVRAQEAYHLDNTRYAADAARLRLRPEAGVTVTVLHASQRGWVGKATHVAHPGKSCVVYFGYPDESFRIITDFEARRAKREGEVACDTF